MIRNKWSHVVAAVGGFVLLAFSGCGMVPVACTEIGCNSGITYELGEDVAMFEANVPIQVRACIDDVCEVGTLTLEEGAQFAGTTRFDLDVDRRALTFRVPGDDFDEEPKTVSLELTRDGTVVLNETREDVALTRTQPNGPGCEPICWFGTVTL